MIKEVVWTVRAVKTYGQIIEYLKEEFGGLVVIEFVKKADNKIELISSNPCLLRKSKSQNNIFLTSVHKRTAVVYRYRPIKKILQLHPFRSTGLDLNKFRF